MVNSLNRLGLPPNCPLENRFLAVALADLVISWEVFAKEKEKKKEMEKVNDFAASKLDPTVVTKKQKSDAGTAIPTSTRPNSKDGSSSSPPNTPQFALSVPMIEVLLNFLVRLSLFTATDVWGRLSAKALLLFKRALTVWDGKDKRVNGAALVRPSYFDKLFEQCREQVSERSERAL